MFWIIFCLKFTLWYSWCLVIKIICSLMCLRLFSSVSRFCLVLSVLGTTEWSPIWTSKCSFCVAKYIGYLIFIVLLCLRYNDLCNAVFILSFALSYQPFASKDGKPCGVGLEAEVVLTRGMSREGEFSCFSVAFGHQNL